MFEVTIRETAYNPWVELQAFEQQLTHKGDFGACTVFTGSMRDYNEGKSVTAMYLEHYPGMTDQSLKSLLDKTANDYQLLAGLIIHRVGEIKTADTIVLTAAWSAHRGEAFNACRHLIETLKHTAPFWKKETLTDGTSRWVEHNTPA